MIISERHLFKGLVHESVSKPSDRLFHRGHALAVSAFGTCIACVSVGILLVIG